MFDIIGNITQDPRFEPFLFENHGSALYSPLNLRYSQAYAAEHEFTDLSFGITDRPELLAVFLLFLNRRDGSEQLDGGGRPASYAISSAISERDAKTVYKRIRERLEQVLANHPQPLLFLEPFPNGALSQPGLYLLEKGATVEPQLSCRIDLRTELAELAADVRKSYKSLLNWGRKNLQMQLVDAQNVREEDVEEFRLLHLRVAGRETRSQETWRLQYEMIRHDEAFLVKAVYQNELVSALLYNFNRQNCFYGVAASIRELFELPISHAPMWLALEYARQRGCRWFEPGEQYFPNFGPDSQKMLDIAKYKRGFGGAIYPQLLLTLAERPL